MKYSPQKPENGVDRYLLSRLTLLRIVSGAKTCLKLVKAFRDPTVLTWLKNVVSIWTLWHGCRGLLWRPLHRTITWKSNAQHCYLQHGSRWKKHAMRRRIECWAVTRVK